MPPTGATSKHGIENEGTPVGAKPKLNFVGAGVDVVNVGNKTEVRIPGGGPEGAFELQDATDITGTPGVGKGWVREAGGSMVWTDLATQAELDAHINDVSAAHAATAVSFAPNGSIAATNVQAAIQEVRDEAGDGGSGGISTAHAWYVDVTVAGGGDGKTPGTAFTTFAAAISAASAHDRINILSNLSEAIVVNKPLVHVAGVGLPIISGSGTSIDDKIITVNAREVTLENLQVRGHAGWKGTAVCVDTAQEYRLVNIKIDGTVNGATATFYPTSVGTGTKTGIGGIGIKVHNADGGYIEGLVTRNCSIAVAGGTWSTRIACHKWFSTQCAQDLVLGLASGSHSSAVAAGAHAYGQTGTGIDAQCGSCLFDSFTSVSVAGSSLTTPPVIDLIGDLSTNYMGEIGSRNVFVNCDLTESGAANRVRIGTAVNTFMNLTTGALTRLDLEGQLNVVNGFYNLGSELRILSDNNHLTGVLSPNDVQLAGSNNILENAQFTTGTIYGAGSSNTLRNVFSAIINAGDAWIYDGFSASSVVTLGTRPQKVVRKMVSALTYATTMTPVSFTGGGVNSSLFTIAATNGTAFTIANPAFGFPGQEFTLDIKNSSGGSMGVVTWGNKYLLAGAFTNPANGKRRLISFYYDAVGDAWVETSRAGADI